MSENFLSAERPPVYSGLCVGGPLAGQRLFHHPYPRYEVAAHTRFVGGGLEGGAAPMDQQFVRSHVYEHVALGGFKFWLARTEDGRSDKLQNLLRELARGYHPSPAED